MEEFGSIRTRAFTSTLAWLSFYVLPERMAEFEVAYKEKVIPILKAHGLVESSERGRATLNTIFSRLFEVRTLSEVGDKREALQEDPAFKEVLQSLGTAFGPGGPENLLQHRFEVYATPAGPGKNVPAGRGTGHWRTYDVTDGLPGASITSIFQDREGHLWFGTYRKGVSRYDGQGFITLTTQDGLAGNEVQSIFQDREGHLWFGTDGGVSRYDGQGFITSTAQDGLADNEVWSIFQDQEGYLWFGTYGGGVSRYDGQGFVTFTAQDGLADNKVWSIFQDQEGYLWFGTDQGVSRKDGQGFVTFTTQDGLAHNRVLSIFQDRGGGLWFGTVGGVSRKDGQGFVTFTTQDGLAHNRVGSIFQDQEGYLWFGTYGGGVSRCDPLRLAGARSGQALASSGSPGTGSTGREMTTFTIEDGLASNYVQSIFQDQEGYLWFGTVGGVSRYDGQTFTNFTIEDGLAGNEVQSIFQDRKGHFWFSTGGSGVSQYDGRTFITFTTGDGLAHDDVWPIFQDREGYLWFGTQGSGVSQYDGQTFTNFTIEDGLAGNWVWSIFQDREGYLWFGTAGGVSRYDGQTFTNFTIKDGLADNKVWSIFQDREGYLWFGTQGSGVSRYDGQRFTTFTTQDGLAHDWVVRIFQDREGYLWFGTWGGVNRYDGQGFITFTTEDGLAGNEVQSIFQDRKGHLWFGTWGGGVSQYDGQVFQTLTHRDGLAGNVVRSVLQDREGYLWFGTLGGVTRYRPPAPSPPSMFIDGVVADRRYEGATGLEIPSSVRLTAFEFHGMSLKTRPEAMIYQFRLKGYDEDWKTTREHRVEYQNLPVGEYTFQVRAVDRGLNYSDPATLQLTVVPDPRIRALAEALSGDRTSSVLVGNSEALRRAEGKLAEVARTDVMVLILGETGTGKGLAARFVHTMSGQREGPFIQVNCGAIPEGLVESELFGHERGAFTGAISRKLGKVELAEGGTLFLDEVGNLVLESQVKLLQLLEERTFERVGGAETLQAAVRVIAATNRDLKQMVTEGQFRGDLYFRLQAFPVRMPSLRERREDISLLADYFMARMAMRLKKEAPPLTSEALALLKAYDWPGNVRELKHTVERAVIICQESAVPAEDIILEFAKRDKGTAEEVVT